MRKRTAVKAVDTEISQELIYLRRRVAKLERLDFEHRMAIDAALRRHIADRKNWEEEINQGCRQLKQAMTGTIQAMEATIEMRDPYTAGHQQRVATLACIIAKSMGLSREKIEGIYMAAVIHDIGKIYIPAEILSKPGKLNDYEYVIIKAHPEVGHNILKNVDFPWPIASAVFQHHERMDGSGYPNGISGNDILLESRILAVSDTVESMASHRPYRPAFGIDKASEEIVRHRGVLYDADVVDACNKLIMEDGFRFESWIYSGDYAGL